MKGWGRGTHTGEQPKSNILSEVSFFLSCQKKNSKFYTSYKNKRPKILNKLHFWDIPPSKTNNQKTLLWVVFFFFCLSPTDPRFQLGEGYWVGEGSLPTHPQLLDLQICKGTLQSD